mgnify:CR=1 FL=1
MLPGKETTTAATVAMRSGEVQAMAVFDDGATKVAIIVCDLLGVSRRIVEPARAAIEAALPSLA